MRVRNVIVIGAVKTVAVSMSMFGGGVAAADDYANQTYADASAAAGDAGQTVIIATRTGDKLAQNDCIVTSSQPAPFVHAEVHVTKLLFNLNCNGGYATATNPGASLQSSAGREAKAAADEAAAAKEQQLVEASTPARN
ncbi:hypothetical protein [Mycobacterium sp. 360MFTsu5.1]|uniref:hypothetical protein n=1 Tax=Mycobacterium sp. 360MFTsu5.1 TaxID=1172186 RepID=UPI00048B6322|nr:hypothetical protein [Mycobacterium sp. 360MFTsu5.1]